MLFLGQISIDIVELRILGEYRNFFIHEYNVQCIEYIWKWCCRWTKAQVKTLYGMVKIIVFKCRAERNKWGEGGRKMDRAEDVCVFVLQ